MVRLRFLVLPAIMALLSRPQAYATTPVPPPITAATLQGTWEGLCVRVDRHGIAAFAVRIQIPKGRPGDISVGLEADHIREKDESLARARGEALIHYDRFPIASAVVVNGKIRLSSGPGEHNILRGVKLVGRGQASVDATYDYGWITFELALLDTNHRCTGVVGRRGFTPSDTITPLRDLRRMIDRFEEMDSHWTRPEPASSRPDAGRPQRPSP